MKSSTLAHSARMAALGAMVLFLASSCIKDAQSPGYEYMPDMYRSPAIEPYVDYGEIRDTIRPELNLTSSARKPVEGTVPLSDNALNDLPFTIPNTLEGYELAGKTLKSPLPQSEEVINQGKMIYADFCVHCHGKEGKGDGPVVTKGGFPPPPAYDAPQIKTLPEGKLFFTVTYGKGLMGQHASQLNKTKRWEVIAYVKTLQGNDDQGEDNGEEADQETTEE